jgi:hypothetical protein
LMAGNEFDGVEERLRDAERWLDPATPGPQGTSRVCRCNGGRRRRGGALAPAGGDRDVPSRAGVGER